ncbi:MAG: pyridoxal 5'-phosphate synthase glutaminase subunit PdxT [Clostridiales bacterium]|jgi:5'-phosphate synthase pdxT subunit|nr:pyridoxal 5'-phosphate synthase glutaminase subunit PdxT [Clostridiales bacterium]
MSNQITIGVLSYQGSVEEHLHCLEQLPNVRAIPVKTLAALEEADGLILPGGESTTISKLLDIFGLMEPLRKRIEGGMPVWGTCAGMILLAKEIVGEPAHLAVMDITVRRNAYGTQLDSFTELVTVPEICTQPIPLTFIRAPWIEKADEKKVQILCRLHGHIVAARQGHMLVTSYHPEVTDDRHTHQYFANMVVSSAE